MMQHNKHLGCSLPFCDIVDSLLSCGMTYHMVTSYHRLKLVALHSCQLGLMLNFTHMHVYIKHVFSLLPFFDEVLLLYTQPYYAVSAQWEGLID